jgi:hypothetical protein
MSKQNLAGAALLLVISCSVQAAEFDVLGKRTLISANTIDALSWSDVKGNSGNRTPGNIRMFYDGRDATPGYARSENFWSREVATTSGYRCC